MYSNPPLHGARLVERILSNKDLRKEWESELLSVANRINDMRKSLRSELEK